VIYITIIILLYSVQTSKRLIQIDKDEMAAPAPPSTTTFKVHHGKDLNERLNHFQGKTAFPTTERHTYFGGDS